MSFILDALKKLERQKQQEEGASGVGETVMEGGRRWGGTKRRIELGKSGVIVAFLALAVAGFALYQSFSVETPEPGPTEPEGAEMQPGGESLPSSGPVAADTRETDTDEEDSTPPRVTQPVMEPEPELTEEDDSIDIESPPEEEVESVPPVRLVGRSSEDQPSGGENSSDGEISEEIPEGLLELVLQGTSVVDGKPIAVINYQRLFEGDTIEGARVIKISDRIVELEYEGKRFFIKL